MAGNPLFADPTNPDVAAAGRELLRRPDAALLADYWLASGEPREPAEPATNADPLLVALMPRRVAHEARQIARRRIAASPEAKQTAIATLRKRYSLLTRAYNVIAPAVGAVAKAPWATMTVVATWLVLHTCHEARVEVLHCAWYRTQDLSATDSVELRNELSQLWISRFAIDTMKTLRDACNAELNRGTPSLPCVRDTISTLERIVIAERSERATIQDLDGKIRHWCPDVDIEHDPAAGARRLFDSDMVSSWLWPTLYFNGSSTGKFVPSAMSCTGPNPDPRVDYERRSARHQLHAYGELVDSIISSSCTTRALLRAYLPTMDAVPGLCDSTDVRPVARQPAIMYLSITLHNVGDKPAEIDLTQAHLTFEGGSCNFKERVRLDPYSHRPAPDLLPGRASVGPGETLQVEAKTDCAARPSSKMAQLHIEGLANDVQVNISDDAVST